MRQVSPHDAHDLMEREGYVYLDVRSVSEFEEGHPAGAYNVPLAEPDEAGDMQENADFVRHVAVALGPDAKVIVGCASGVRSRIAAERLSAGGFDAVVDQHAGMIGVRDPFGRMRERGWRSLDLPVSTEAEPGRSFREIAARAARNT